MFLTEEQAKTKWCPMARQLGTLEKFKDGAVVSMGSQNRGYQMGGALENCKCIASDCMMWRNDRASGHGYCGLAGKVR